MSAAEEAHFEIHDDLQPNEWRIHVECRYGSFVPMTVSASNLRAALNRAAARPLAEWLPPDGGE